MTLFHGTGEEDPDQILTCKDGIDFRISNRGQWGYASYFTDDVRFSNSFAFKVPMSNLKIMFQVRLLAGNAVSLPEDPKLIIPPLMPNVSEDVFCPRYDTMHGEHQSGYDTYVVYCNHRDHTEYLIKYVYNS